MVFPFVAPLDPREHDLKKLESTIYQKTVNITYSGSVVVEKTIPNFCIFVIIEKFSPSLNRKHTCTFDLQIQKRS
jgi:hypothetical protein